VNAPTTATRSTRIVRIATVLAVTASTVAALTGCTAPSSTAPKSTTSHKLTSVEFINPAPAQPAWQVTAKCFTAEAAKKGLKSKVVGIPGNDTDSSAEIGFIEQATADGEGGIAATSYANTASLEPAFEAAHKKGIIVATMESGDATAARTFDVGLDIPKFGRDMADQVASRPGNHIVAIVDPGLTGTPKIFNDAFESEIKGKSNITVLQIINDNGAVTTDADLVGSLLVAHPNVTDIVAVNPGSTAGIVTAIQEHNLVGKVFLTGNSKAAPAQAALDSGAAAAFYVQKQCDLGTFAVDNIVLASEGKKVPRDIPVSTSFATKKNFASFNSDWD
jgi:erythritol transport system substrate-binding protein